MANDKSTVISAGDMVSIRADIALALIEIAQRRGVCLQVGEIKQTGQLRGKLHRVDFEIAA